MPIFLKAIKLQKPTAIIKIIIKGNVIHANASKVFCHGNDEFPVVSVGLLDREIMHNKLIIQFPANPKSKNEMLALIISSAKTLYLLIITVSDVAAFLTRKSNIKRAKNNCQ